MEIIEDWQPIITAPEWLTLLVWEKDYGQLMASYQGKYGWKIKSSGNFWAPMPDSVIEKLKFWRYIPNGPDFDYDADNAQPVNNQDGDEG